MNKEQRARVKTIIDDLAPLVAALDMAIDDFEEITGEEEDKLSNMPESLQNGEKGEKLQGYIDTLNSMVEKANEAKDALEELDNLQSDLE